MNFQSSRVWFLKESWQLAIQNHSDFHIFYYNENSSHVLLHVEDKHEELFFCTCEYIWEKRPWNVIWWILIP
jgi:hypothetical protein